MQRTAIILAGGKSSRFGEDKCFLKWLDGEILIKHQLIALNFLEEIIISGPKDKFSFLNVKVVEDEFGNVGPIEGLRRGLAASKNKYNFLISCDMPLVNKPLIEYMFSVCFDYEAVICENGRYIEPIYGVYSKSLITSIENNIKSEKYSFRELLFSSNVLFIPEKVVRIFSEDLSVFANLNTKKDLYKYFS